jgi:hypothetical protein
MLSLVTNPLATLLLLLILLSQSLSLQIHMDAVMRYPDLILLPDRCTKTITFVRLPNYLSFMFIVGFSGPTKVFTNLWLLASLAVFLENLLNTSCGHLHAASDLFCSHTLAVLTNDPTNLRLVQFHIPEYDSGIRWGAK